jgi:hypothetical protein
MPTATPVEDRQFVALRRQRFGEEMLGVGDPVPIEPGRNYGLMLRQGLIADLEDHLRTEEEQSATVDALQLRNEKLEGLLADSRAETAEFRQKHADALAATDGPKVEELQAQLAAEQEARTRAENERDAAVAKAKEAAAAPKGAPGKPKPARGRAAKKGS